MSISIASGVSAAVDAAAYSSSATVAAHSTQQTTDDTADTVKLSESQQVYQLYNQGQSVNDISENLNLSLNEVNNYLNITSNAK